MKSLEVDENGFGCTNPILLPFLTISASYLQYRVCIKLHRIFTEVQQKFKKAA